MKNATNQIVNNFDENITRNKNKAAKPTLQIQSNESSNNNKVTTISWPTILTLKETRVTCVTIKEVITSIVKGVAVQQIYT